MTGIRKNVRTALIAAVAATSTLGLSAPALAGQPAQDEAPAEKNIVETAMSTGTHTTLVAAVKAAGLADTLASPGPFTIFAPTDAAFAALPDGTVETLLLPENKGQLAGILAYHAVAGEVTSTDLIALITEGGGQTTIETIAGPSLTAAIVDGNVVITDGAGRTATVTAADVETSNGVIHITDGVFLPG